jgi:hypothetical protein
MFIKIKTLENDMQHAQQSYTAKVQRLEIEKEKATIGDRMR